MKRLLFILSLITILTASGCMNAVVSEDSPSDTEIVAETPNTAVPSIMIGGELYYTTGTDIPIEVDPSVIKTAKVIDSKKLPEHDGEINFPVTDAKYALINDTETYVVVMIDHEWVKFEKREEEADSEIERARLKIQEKNNHISILESLNKEYLGFIDKALEYLDDDELIEVSRPLFKYTLTVNDEPIPKNGKITFEKAPVIIRFTSETLTNLNLPQIFYDNGRLSGNYFLEHLEFGNQKPDEEEITDGTVVQSIIYTFGKDDPIEELKFSITDELKERLELDTTTITVSISD